VLDFVEGFHYTKGEKAEPNMPIRATVRSKLVEITVWTVQQALDIEGTTKPTARKPSKEFDTKYTATFGLEKTDFSSDGIQINGFTDKYHDRVKALIGLMYLKKTSQYANKVLLHHLYQAVTEGNLNWAPLILASLRRLLVQIHTSHIKDIKGAELIDVLLRLWFPDDEEYVGHTTAQKHTQRRYMTAVAENQVCHQHDHDRNHHRMWLVERA